MYFDISRGVVYPEFEVRGFLAGDGDGDVDGDVDV